jgi:type IV pilus biogenesis/stability protein PilW
MSLIIDAIKKAQQLRLKELKEVPFLRGYGPKGIKGEPKTKHLALFLASGLTTLMILFLWGDNFFSLFIPPQKQNIAFIEKGTPLEPRETNENHQDLQTKETPTVRIGKDLASTAFFIEVEEEKPLTKQKSKKKKKKMDIMTEEETEKSELLQTFSAKPLLEEKAPPPIQPSIGAKEEKVAEPSNQKGEEKKTDSHAAKVPKPSETPAIPLAEQIPQEKLSSLSKEEGHSEPKSEDKEIKKIRTQASDAIIHFNLGVEFHNRREILKAAQAYQKAIEIDPTYIEAYNNLGILYQEIGDLNKALEAYQKAIEINPRYEKTLNNLGILFLLTNRYNEAIEAFRKAIAINPTNIESYINLGILFRKQGQTDKAIESYQEALALDPLNGETHYNIGLLHEQLEHFDLAISHYQRFVQLSSKSHPELAAKVQRHLKQLVGTKTNQN